MKCWCHFLVSLSISHSLSVRIRVLLSVVHSICGIVCVCSANRWWWWFEPKWKSMKIIFYVSIPLRPFVFVINNRDSFISFNRFQWLFYFSLPSKNPQYLRDSTNWKIEKKIQIIEIFNVFLKIWSFWFFDNDNLWLSQTSNADNPKGSY